jgi:hypothetical protein
LVYLSNTLPEYAYCGHSVFGFAKPIIHSGGNVVGPINMPSYSFKLNLSYKNPYQVSFITDAQAKDHMVVEVTADWSQELLQRANPTFTGHIGNAPDDR